MLSHYLSNSPIVMIQWIAIKIMFLHATFRLGETPSLQGPSFHFYGRSPTMQAKFKSGF